MNLKETWNEIKKLRWKNMKNTEKKFIITTVIALIVIIVSCLFVFFSIYSWVMGNPKQLDIWLLLKTEKFNVYIPHKEMFNLFKTTPNAYIKTKNIFKWVLITEFLLWFFIALPFKYKRKDITHGSARWANFDDLGYSGFFFPTKYAKAFELNLLEENGVVLGEYNGRILRDNGKTHIILSAPTRTGKGVSVIIPTLVDTWKDSVLVLDVKGENHQMTAGWRKKEFKNKILKFSPKKKDSCKFNPLQEIRYLTDKEIEDAQVIAKLIVIGDSSSSDPFWENAGSDFILGIIMYELYRTRGKAGLGNVVDFITDASKPINKRMTEIITKPMFDKNNFEDREIMEKLTEIYPMEADVVKKGFHPFVIRAMADTLQKGEKTMASIIATAKAALSVFELPTVKYNTSDSDFRIMDLMAGDKPISLYIVIEPGDLQALAPLLRILIIQCVTLLTPEMDYTGNNKNAVKFKHRLLMLLDEFPSIGKMEILEKAIGYVAGYGMKMMLVVQSLDQLNKIYTKDNAFLSNCQNQIFYTSNENQTSEYISKTIGTETVISKSYSGGIIKRNSTISKTGRELLKAEEMRRFPLDKILLLVGGKYPIQTKKILFFDDKRFKHKIKIPIDPTPAMQAEMEIMKRMKK